MDKYQKRVIFTKTPLKKYFLYPGKFQIYPADLEGMPKSTLQNHFPVILEYKIEEGDIIEPDTDDLDLKDLTTLAASTITKQEEILNLLTLFTNHLFFRYSSASDGNWGIPVLKDKPGEEANSWTSKWILKMFHWPELPKQLKIDKFTDVELIYDPVEFVPFLKYYQHDPNLDFDKKREITFPNNIFKGIEAFYSLDEEGRKVIDTAISHSVSAIN